MMTRNKKYQNHHSKMFCLLLVLGFIPPNVCQLALASTSFVKEAPTSPRKAAALSKGLNFRDTRSRPLFTKYGSFNSPMRFNNTDPMEMEIAAIFKEFAYGSSTTSSTTSSSTTPTTILPWYNSETSSPRNYFRSDITEPRKFIGEQREVFKGIPVTSEESKHVPKTDSTTKTSVYYDDSELSYLINTSDDHKDENSIKGSKRNPIPTNNIYSSHENDDNGKNVHIQVTSTLKKKGYEAIQEQIGRAWSFHVYSTGISFCIVAVICIFSLSRISTCSQLLPRGYFITLHLMIFLASFLRAVLFLHDPYGAYERLPSVLTALLFNSVGPCLTTAYSIVFLVLLRAARIRLVPLNMQSPLVLATVCGIHIGGSVVIDVSSGVLENKDTVSTLNIITQSITVAWGCLLCLGYVISFTGIEKSAQRQQSDLVRLTLPRKVTDDISLTKSPLKSSLIYAARLFLICTLMHGLIIAFIILNLVNTKVPISATSSEAWAWWTQTSLERIVEIVLCILLLATALVLTHSKSKNIPRGKDDSIFSILPHCKSTSTIKNLDVYPISNDKGTILGNRTLRNSTLNKSGTLSGEHSLKKQYVIHSPGAEYNKNPQLDSIYVSSPMFLPFVPTQISSSTMRSSGLKEKDLNCDYIKRTNQVAKQDYDKYISHINGGNNIYTQSDCCRNSSINSQVKNQQNSGYYIYRGQQCIKENPCNTGSVIRNSSPPYYISTLNCNNKMSNEYEIAPYYNSNESTSSHVYTKPYSCQANTNIHRVDLHQSCHRQKHRQSAEFGPKSETSLGSSLQSEIHVDYLTDISSSNDCLSVSLSNSRTLPLFNQYCSVAGEKNNLDEITDVHGDDLQKAVDYSSHVEESANYFNADIKNVDNNSNPLSFLRVSTTSLNEVLKGQTGLLGKFVNGGNNISNYAPLCLDDSISSPSSDCNVIKKSISTGDLSDLKDNTNGGSGSETSKNRSSNNKQLTIV